MEEVGQVMEVVEVEDQVKAVVEEEVMASLGLVEVVVEVKEVQDLASLEEEVEEVTIQVTELYLY